MNKPVFKMDLMNPGDWVDRDIISAGWKECNDDSDCKPWEYCSSYKRNGRATGATIRAVSCGSYYIIKNS